MYGLSPGTAHDGRRSSPGTLAAVEPGGHGRQLGRRPRRVDDVGGAEAAAQRGRDQRAQGRRPAGDQERSPGPGPDRHGGRHRGRRIGVGAGRLGADRLVAARHPQQPEQHGDPDGHADGGGDDAGRRGGLRVVEVGEEADGTEGDEAADGHPRPAHGGEAERGAEQQRHDHDAHDERRLVVGAEHGDGHVLQRRREPVDELRADGGDERRPVAPQPAHELPGGQRGTGREHAAGGGDRPTHRPDVSGGCAHATSLHRREPSGKSPPARSAIVRRRWF